MGSRLFSKPFSLDPGEAGLWQYICRDFLVIYAFSDCYFSFFGKKRIVAFIVLRQRNRKQSRQEVGPTRYTAH